MVTVQSQKLSIHYLAHCNQVTKGFTLLEILIAMLVLAFGLLGLAGLQTAGLRNNQSAIHRSQATQLAYDIADRMRANTNNAKLYDSSIYITQAPASATTQTGCTTIANTCTPTQMAQHDLFEWNRDIADNLPLGLGSISVTQPIYTITISWDDNHSGARDTTFTMGFQL